MTHMVWQQPLAILGEESIEKQEIIYLYPHKNKGWVDIYSSNLCLPQGANRSLPAPQEIVIIAVSEKKLQTYLSGADLTAVCMCI